MVTLCPPPSRAQRILETATAPFLPAIAMHRAARTARSLGTGGVSELPAADGNAAGASGYVLVSEHWLDRDGGALNALATHLHASGMRIVRPLPDGTRGVHSISPHVFADALLDAVRRLGQPRYVIGAGVGAGAAIIALTRGLKPERSVLADAMLGNRSICALAGHRMRMPGHCIRVLEKAVRPATAISDRALALQLAYIGSPALHVCGRGNDWTGQAEAIALLWADACFIESSHAGDVLDDPGIVRIAARFLAAEPVGTRPVASHDLALDALCQH